MPLTPVGILTGFLGSGKTTVLSRLLPRPEFADTVVVINEFGEVSIDHLIVAHLSESIVELRNGCLCCTVRGDLIMTLRDLHRQRQLGEIRRFNRVLIETSGLAEPVPLLHTLMANPPLQKAFAIDSLVTVVDAEHATATVAQHHAAADQIALADLILLSKTDLADTSQVSETRRLIKTLNVHAEIRESTNDALQQIFGESRFNPEPLDAALRHWLEHHEHSAELTTHSHGYVQHVIRYSGEISLAGLTVFLNQAVNTQKEGLLRIKGIASVRDKRGKTVVVHGVQNKFYPVQWLSEWSDSEPSCRLVFIGRDLDVQWLEERFRSLCV